MSRLLASSNLFSRAFVRRFATSEIKSQRADLSAIAKKQAHFQVDDDVPVYLKGGSFDHFLFYTTLALTVFGVGTSMHSLYKLAVKNK